MPNLEKRKGYLFYLQESERFFKFIGFLSIAAKYERMQQLYLSSEAIYLSSGYLAPEQRSFHDAKTLPLEKVFESVE